MRLLVLVLVALPACKSDFPLYCDDTTPCTDPARPFCDRTGQYPASAGHGNICIPTPDGIPDAGPMTDGSPADADPSVPPDQPALLAPAFGHFTGSVHAERSLKPRLRWNAAPGALTYDLQLDDSCPVIDFALCAFGSPEVDQEGITEAEFQVESPLPVSMQQPVGRRYFWRVRACNSAGCSPWSAVRYLNVGRQLTDYNGDGYGDLVAGAAGLHDRIQDSSDEGTVGDAFLYFGEPSWRVAAELESEDARIADPRAEADGAFGLAITSAGDVNADGFSDFIVTAPLHDLVSADAGAAYLYLGRASWTSPVSAADSQIYNPNAETSLQFGRSVAGGFDMNGDGYSDFAVGRVDMSQDPPSGEVYVYFGKPAWFSVTTDPSLRIPRNGPTNDGHGIGLAAGDVDGDGYADVLIGAAAAHLPEEAEGAAYGYSGRADWGSLPVTLDTPDLTFDNPRDETGSAFGWAIAVADLDNDGLQDIAISAPYMSEPEGFEGNVFIYQGRLEWPTSTLETAETAIDHPDDRPLGIFGFSLSAAGDVTGDGITDLLVGAPTSDDEGGAYLYPGRSSWPGALPTADITLPNPLSSDQGRMGVAVSTTDDMDGDGLAELVVGAPNQDKPESDEGVVFLWFGREDWLGSPTPDLLFDNPRDASDRHFGVAVD